MGALTLTELTKRMPIGDRMVQTWRATTGSAATADEWLATGLTKIEAIYGSCVIGTLAGAAMGAPVKASGTITFSDVNVAGKLVTIDGIIYTSDADPDVDGSQPYFYNVHATTEEGAAGHLADVINAGNGQGAEAAVIPGVGTFGFGCAPHPTVVATVSGAVVTVTARVAGTAGNAITLTTDETNATVSAATLAGGTDGTSSLTPTPVFRKNARGTGVAEDVNLGDLAVECAVASVVFEVTILGMP